MPALLIVTQFAGIFLLLATMVLLFFRRIYLDAETKQPIKFTLPLFGEISTQAPVLVLVLIGAFMVVFPLSKMEAPRAIMEGEIDTGGKSVTVLVVADPDYVHHQDANGPFNIKIPLLATAATYRIKYVVNKVIIADQIATLKDGHIALSPVQWSEPPEEGAMGRIPIKKDVSDEELHKLSIAN